MSEKVKKQRFIVTRMWVKHKGQIYKTGELLPEDFTELDRFRNVYPGRIGMTEVKVDDEGVQAPAAATLEQPEVPEEGPPANKTTGQDPESGIDAGGTQSSTEDNNGAPGTEEQQPE
jgi:hypothetical protein